MVEIGILVSFNIFRFGSPVLLFRHRLRRLAFKRTLNDPFPYQGRMAKSVVKKNYRYWTHEGLRDEHYVVIVH